MSKMRRTRQGGEVWELVTRIGSSCCQFLFTEFVDSSCYQMIQVCFQIFAMGHRYGNSITNIASSGLTISDTLMSHHTIARHPVLPPLQSISNLLTDLQECNLNRKSMHLSRLLEVKHHSCCIIILSTSLCKVA